MAKTKTKGQLTNEVVINRIYLVRGKRVMMDEDLAELYHVETKRLNEQVKRNAERFPSDFMFQLTEKEFQNLKSQTSHGFYRARSGHAFECIE